MKQELKARVLPALSHCPTIVRSWPRGAAFMYDICMSVLTPHLLHLQLEDRLNLVSVAERKARLTPDLGGGGGAKLRENLRRFSENLILGLWYLLANVHFFVRYLHFFSNYRSFTSNQISMMLPFWSHIGAKWAKGGTSMRHPYPMLRH